MYVSVKIDTCAFDVLLLYYYIDLGVCIAWDECFVHMPVWSCWISSSWHRVCSM